MAYLNQNKNALHPKVIYFEKAKDNIEVEISMQYTEAYNESIFSYTNNINTIEGGTHLSGFRSALTLTVNQYAKGNGLIKDEKEAMSGDDIREGLTAIVSVKVPDPQFEGQTKTKLGNSDVKGIVEAVVNVHLAEFFEFNPAIAKRICEKAIGAARSREAARKGKDLGKRINRFEEARANGELKPSIPVPPEPGVTFESLTQGKALFTKLQCHTCHGDTGAGDGPSAPTLKDKWGLPLLPRDFNIGAFRGGSAGRDLYLRLATGLAGTPMPPFGDDVLKPDEGWALVHFVQSLPRKDAEVHDILAPEDATIRVVRAAQLPTTPSDPAWEQYASFRIPLNPQITITYAEELIASCEVGLHKNLQITAYKSSSLFQQNCLPANDRNKCWILDAGCWILV